MILACWFWGRRFSKNISVHFHSFAIISPWRWPIPFLETNLNPLPVEMISAKFI
jgi:hypothetical protein